MKDTLLIYYSLSAGNTKNIANRIKESLNCDVEQIDTITPYIGTYEEIVNQGKEEVNSEYKPKIKPLSVDISKYNKIIIGTPTWWYTMAPAILTLLSDNDWADKVIVPFQTHGGWPGHVIDDIKQICKNAKFENEFAVQFDSTGGDKLVTSEKEIDEWIKSL